MLISLTRFFMQLNRYSVVFLGAVLCIVERLFTCWTFWVFWIWILSELHFYVVFAEFFLLEFFVWNLCWPSNVQCFLKKFSTKNASIFFFNFPLNIHNSALCSTSPQVWLFLQQWSTLCGLNFAWIKFRGFRGFYQKPGN